MKEIKDIIRAFDEAQQEGKQTALATVVHVEGSSYRRPGARMLVTEDGKLTGAISGGCLEGDALRKARLVMMQQQSMLVTYDTTDDDDAKLGVGLGCNGIIQILIEPIDPASPVNPIQLFKTLLSKRQAGVVVTLFSLYNKRIAQPGTCLLLTTEAQVIKSAIDEETSALILADAREALVTGTSLFKTYETDQKLTGFVEVIQPAVALVIAGAGNDAIPLLKMATVLGWEVTIAEGRASYLTKERFPEAQRLIIAKSEAVLEQLQPDERTVFVLMTHNYIYDLTLLRQLLPMQLPYVGMLGPKKKLNRMLDELRDEGQALTEEQLKSIYGPTGLDIGAETPEEIALSIISEIKAVLSKKDGGSLRDKDFIHSRDTQMLNADKHRSTTSAKGNSTCSIGL